MLEPGQNNPNFRGYMKYKIKYNLLKETIELNKAESQSARNQLYQLFTNSDIVDSTHTCSQDCEPNIKPSKRKSSMIEKNNLVPSTTPDPYNGKRKTKLPAYLNDYETKLTPSINNTFTPETKRLIAPSLETDNLIINNLQQQNDLTDDDYVLYENYGKLLEAFFTDEYPCPVCKNYTLKRYANNNFPVIDVLCTNASHGDGVRFFQIKSSDGTLFRANKYFSLETKTIHVGSYTYGQYVHSITPFDDAENKRALIGYICIFYQEYANKLRIIPTKSFVVIPKSMSNITGIVPKKLFDSDNSISANNWYYRYVENEMGENIIEFNDFTNGIFTFDNIYHGKPLNVDKHYPISENRMTNPMENIE